MTNRGRLAAGAATLLLCVQYFVAEAITAAAWERPYSYSRNYISDLGVATCLAHGPCSPLAWVMNGAFALAGVLTIAAALLLGSVLLPVRRWRRLVTVCAVTHGVGSLVVGLVHSAPGTPTGTPHLHVLGAYAAILGGNLGLIVVGLTLPTASATRWVRAASVSLGVLGIACGAALVLTRGLPPGLLERGAVDTIPVWEVSSGLLLAAQLLRRRSPAPALRTS